METVYFYTIRHIEKRTGKWIKTRWQMTEEEAATRFSDTQWEVVPGSGVERKIGGGVIQPRLMFTHLMGKGPAKPDE